MGKRMLKNNLNRMRGITIAIFLLLFWVGILSGNKDIYGEENKSVDEKHQEYLELCQKEINTGENNEQNNKTETKDKKQKDSPQEQAKKKLIKLLQMNNFASKHLLVYSMLDLDQDGTKEFISRSYTPESTEGGAYVYNIYQYDENAQKYKRVSSAAFYSFVSEDCIYFWKEQRYLVIDCSMGEYDFILYSFQDGSLHEEYDVLADMSYLPKVEFKEVKLSKTKEGKSYKKFIERGLFKKETDGLNSVMYGVYDLEGDGVYELIMRGKDSNQKYQYLLSTYKNGKRQTRGFLGNWKNGGEWDWDSFENSLTEILFYPIPWSENEMQQNYEASKKGRKTV